MQHDTTITKPDLGPRELRQHHIVEEIETTEVRKRAQVRSSIPIDYYYHRGWIDQQQWEAGNRLYYFWYYGAEKSAYTISAMNGLPPAPAYAPSNVPAPVHKVALEKKYNKAMKVLDGAMARLVIYNVVCIGEWATYIKAAIGRDRRMELLREGLTDLAKHFGIPEYEERKK